MSVLVPYTKRRTEDTVYSGHYNFVSSWRMTLLALMANSSFCATTLLSINSSSSSCSFSTSIPPSFTRSDSGSAVTAPSPSHASAVRPAFVTRGGGVEGGVRRSEISHRLNILTWNLCWWWLPLPSSDPSVASSPKRILHWHRHDYDLAVVYSLSPSFSFSLHPAPRPHSSSKDCWVKLISNKRFCQLSVSLLFLPFSNAYCHSRAEDNKFMD